MKDSATRSYTTSQQWPGVVLPPDAKDICHRVPAFWKSPACSQLEPTKNSARWLPTELAAAGRAREAAPSQISFSPSSSCTQSKEKTEYQRSCVLATYRKTMPIPRALQSFLHHTCCGNACVFLRGKQGRTNHHRLNTTPGLRHQYPS